mgnify:CR=1 FL=1
MKAHGYADITWKKNVLILDVHGPFNDEGVLQTVNDIKKSVLDKNVKDWFRIEKLDEEALGSPLTISIVNEMYLWADNHGCQATAVVVSNQIQAKTMVEISKDINYKVFRNSYDAENWIAQQ